MSVYYKDIIENDYILSNDAFKWIEFDKKINFLKSKYSNLLNEFSSFDGFAFSSKDYVTKYKGIKNKTRLIQIGNVNETEWIVTKNQKFEFLPNTYISNKSRYLLKKKCILLSLTGSSDLSKDISSFFDNSFNAFLNQRVAAYSIKEDNEDYFFFFYAFTKSLFFKEQWLGKGGIQKNTGASEKGKVFVPKLKNSNLIKYVSVLTQAIINKEKAIRKRHNDIFSKIETELLENQKPNKFNFNYPTFNEIAETGRFDTSLYTNEFKKWNFIVKNYKNGSVDLISRGFDWSRGTSLEKNFIKTRIDSDKYLKGFYELVLPTNISEYGYVEKQQFIGTPTSLKTIKQGDIIFGGEGFGKGRTYVVINESRNVATNYHGIRIINKNEDLTESIFIRCFLAFWREKGMIDYIGVGGSGGHCAPSYFHLIETPKFNTVKQEEIAKLYHNSETDFEKLNSATLNNFLDIDNEFNSEAGIFELDKSAKRYKERLDEVINKIANDKEIDIDFNLIEIENE